MSYSRNSGIPFMVLLITAGAIYGVFKLLNTYITGHFFLSLLLIIGVVLFIWLFLKLIKNVYKLTPKYKREQERIKQEKEQNYLERKKEIEERQREERQRQREEEEKRKDKIIKIRIALREWRYILDTPDNPFFRISTDILSKKKLLNNLKECYVNHAPDSKHPLQTHYFGIEKNKNGVYVYSEELEKDMNELYADTVDENQRREYELDLKYDLQSGATTPEELVENSIRDEYNNVYYRSNEYHIEFETDTFLSFEEFFKLKVNTKKYRDELWKFRKMRSKKYYSRPNNGQYSEPYDGSVDFDHDTDY